MHKQTRMLPFIAAFVLCIVTAGWSQCPTYISPEEAANLDKIVGNAQIVVFGESSHFLTAVHCLNAEVFRHLVEKKGFRVFVFESAWGIDDQIQEFLHSGRKTVTENESFFLNAFNSGPTLEMLYYIREHNRKFPKDRIRISGIQPEQPVSDFQAVWKIAELSSAFPSSGLREAAASCKASTGDYKDDIEFIGYTANRRRKEKLPTYTNEERQKCLAGLTAIEQFLQANQNEVIRRSSPAQFKEAVLHVKSIRNYVAVLSGLVDFSLAHPNPSPEEALQLGHDMYEKGDASRFEVFQTLMQTRYGKQKIFLWMHDWHAAKHSENILYTNQIPTGTHSFTSRLADAYGKKLVVIGGIVGCPSCDPKPPADAIEARFSAALGDKTVFIDLRKPSAKYGDLPLHTPGSLWIQVYKDRLERIVLSEQFDAVYFLPRSKATFEK